MAIVAGWLPASRENYELVLSVWQWFWVASSLQWFISWYGMGKTSVASRLNLPGRFAWATMETPGFVTLLYIMNTLPEEQGITDLPWQNKVLAAFFVIHYIYRAVIFPIIQPSMAPIHILVWLFALVFQLCNATCLGSWLAAYGPTSQEDWEARGWTVMQFSLGFVVFYAGLTTNYFCDEELREIRRREMRRQEKLAKGGQKNVKRLYSVPQNGLFRYMLYPHYFMEWMEWLGFWIAAGFSCAPARCFLVNEFFSMLPRAVAGKKWYQQKFGDYAVREKYAVIPGVW